MVEFEDNKNLDNSPGKISELIWKSRVSYLKPLVIKEVMICLSAGFLFVLIVMALFQCSVVLDMLYILFAIFASITVSFLIIMFLMNVFTKGGAETVFMINKQGVGYTNASEELDKKINRLTLAGSVIGGSLSGAGLSLINISREMDFIEWNEIRHIILYKSQKVIYIRRKIWVAPFALFCTPENFTLAVDIIKRNAPHVKIKEGTI